MTLSERSTSTSSILAIATPNLFIVLSIYRSIVYFIVYLPFNVRSDLIFVYLSSYRLFIVYSRSYIVRFTLSSLNCTFIGLTFAISAPSIAIFINFEGKEEIEKDEPC